MPLIEGRTSGAVVIPVQVDGNGVLSSTAHGYYSGAFRKSPIAFGASGVVRVNVSNTALVAGSNTLESGAVPAGELWVITNLVISYVGTVTNVALYMSFYSGASNVDIFAQIPPVSNVRYDRQGWWVMQPTETLRLRIFGATLNDDAFLVLTGFRVDIDL